MECDVQKYKRKGIKDIKKSFFTVQKETPF